MTLRAAFPPHPIPLPGEERGLSVLAFFCEDPSALKGEGSPLILHFTAITLLNENTTVIAMTGSG
jgi:hypothetical protein